MTILESILSFAGASISSGITWDILKGSGQKLIMVFKEKFIENGSFTNKDECEQFLKTIVDSSPNSKKNPYKDAQNIYEDIVNIPMDNFIDLFKIWINENLAGFEQIRNINIQHVSVKIEHQQNHGQGNIINAGIINNN